MLGLSFLFPAFLLGALAVAVPIVLHLLKREAAPAMPFSAVRFLRRAPVEQSRRQRLRELLLLALRVTALLLLAFAFARPYLADATAGATAPIALVLLDTSHSMSGPGRMEQARALARQAIDAAPADHRVGVVTFDDEVRVVVDPSLDRGAALAALPTIEAGFGATRFGPALSRAAQIIGSRPGAVTVVSDLQASGWTPESGGALPDQITVETAVVEPVEGNLSVEDVRRAGNETVVTIRHAGLVPTETHLEVTLDGRSLADLDIECRAGAPSDVVVPVPWPSKGQLVVRVADPGGLAGDNARFVITDPPTPSAVVVVGNSGAPLEDAFYLVSALTAAGEASRFTVTGATGDSLEASDERLGSADAVVLISTRSLGRAGWRALAAYVGGGGGLLVALGPDVDPGVVDQILGGDETLRIATEPTATAGLTFAPTDVRHPIFRPFVGLIANLGQVRFQRSRRMEVEPGPNVRVLATLSDGSAALVERTLDDGRVLLLASDTETAWNDFPMHPAFVPFLHEALRHLSRDRVSRPQVVVADRPAGTPASPGFVVDERSERRVAINLDSRESLLAPLSAETFLAGVPRLDRSVGAITESLETELENQQGWWRYGLLLLLLALGAEGLLGARVA